MIEDSHEGLLFFLFQVKCLKLDIEDYRRWKISSSVFSYDDPVCNLVNLHKKIISLTDEKSLTDYIDSFELIKQTLLDYRRYYILITREDNNKCSRILNEHIKMIFDGINNVGKGDADQDTSEQVKPFEFISLRTDISEFVFVFFDIPTCCSEYLYYFLDFLKSTFKEISPSLGTTIRYEFKDDVCVLKISGYKKSFISDLTFLIYIYKENIKRPALFQKEKDIIESRGIKINQYTTYDRGHEYSNITYDIDNLQDIFSKITTNFIYLGSNKKEEIDRLLKELHFSPKKPKLGDYPVITGRRSNLIQGHIRSRRPRINTLDDYLYHELILECLTRRIYTFFRNMSGCICYNLVDDVNRPRYISFLIESRNESSDIEYNMRKCLELSRNYINSLSERAFRKLVVDVRSKISFSDRRECIVENIISFQFLVEYKNLQHEIDNFFVRKVDISIFKRRCKKFFKKNIETYLCQ